MNKARSVPVCSCAITCISQKGLHTESKLVVDIRQNVKYWVVALVGFNGIVVNEA